jgi:hypothetical protein
MRRQASIFQGLGLTIVLVLSWLTLGLPVRMLAHSSEVAETLGTQTNRWLSEFEVRDCWIVSDGDGGFSVRWTATLRRTNWPPRLVMPVQTPVENGVVRLLPWLLDNADARVRPILQSPWLMKLVDGSSETSIEVAPNGSTGDSGRSS